METRRTLNTKAYVLRERIGQGGQGVVHRAVHRLSQVEVAVKIVMLKTKQRGTRREGRLIRGCTLLERLRHPNVVSVQEHGAVPGGYVVVTEFVRGQTLDDLIAEEGPLPWAQALRLIDGIADGVAHAHERGIVHRDLKPKNVVIDEHMGLPRVIDFDLAKEENDDGALSKNGFVVGTLSYLAPEKLCGGTETGPAEDVYCLGLMLYQMLTGKNPFLLGNRARCVQAIVRGQVQPLLEVVPDVPPAVADEIMRAMSRDPRQRHANAREFRAALTRALETEESSITKGLDVLEAEAAAREALQPRLGRSALRKALSGALMAVPCLLASFLAISALAG